MKEQADLDEYVRGLARFISRDVPPAVRDEFVAGEFARVYCAGRAGGFQHRPDSTFGGFASTVLHRDLIDGLRKWKRQKKRGLVGRGADPEDRADGPLAMNVQAEPPVNDTMEGIDLEWESPLSDRDLNTIAAWLVRTRLILLTMIGLWRRVPAAHWDAWINEQDLDRPFPPRCAFIEADAPSRRHAILAGVFGMSRDAFNHFMSYNRERLRDIEAARDLFGDHP